MRCEDDLILRLLVGRVECPALAPKSQVACSRTIIDEDVDTPRLEKHLEFTYPLSPQRSRCDNEMWKGFDGGAPREEFTSF
jgi:hypothetical protein